MPALSSRLRRRAVALLRPRPALTFVLMGVAFFGFGIASVNLVTLFRANLGLIVDYGWMALVEGAFVQFLQLCGSAALALVFWVVFKCCEKLLLDRLTRDGD